MNSNNVPVLITIFNRPETTQKLISALRKVMTTNLYVVADGARANKPGEKQKCEETRQIIETIDWPCNVHKKYFEENHGCDPTIEIALNWFFEQVEMGIIFEDDCLPDPTFFDFADTMLEKYKNDERILHINGSNFQFGKTCGDGSYYFSRYAHSWGYATWRRAWKLYDHNLSTFPRFKTNKQIDEIIKNRTEQKFWLGFFQKLYNNKFPFWDARWTYAIWSHNGMCITPNQNLVENIGWQGDATHTDAGEKITNRLMTPMQNIIDPSTKNICEEADWRTFWHYYYRSFWQKLQYKIRHFLK